MVFIAPVRNDHKYDEFLEKCLDSAKARILSQDDDSLILVVGDTGSGKSHLSLHMFERYLGKEASIDYCGLNKSSIAKALKAATDKPLPRCLWVDEANINKRDSLSKFNKDMIDLYFSIRGLQIFHVWCNPSLDMMDKFFIEERIKGIFYITNKNPKVRLYYYFKKESILKIYNKYGHLKLPLLYKIRKKYAYYRGWFKVYDGFLLEDYLKKKDDRMEEKVANFYDKWSEKEIENLNFVTIPKMSKLTGLSLQTVYNYVKILDGKDIFNPENRITNISGISKYNLSLIPEFKKLAVKSQNAKLKNLQIMHKKKKK
ncbi:MAG: hypothetical protein ABH824_04290 [Nanoarchaeota archaeon]